MSLFIVVRCIQDRIRSALEIHHRARNFALKTLQRLSTAIIAWYVILRQEMAVTQLPKWKLEEDKQLLTVISIRKICAVKADQ